MPTKNIRIVAGKTQFRSTYADSNALWQVIRSQGKGTYLCEIVNEQITIDGRVLDGDYAGVQKAFLREEISRALNFENYWDKVNKQGEEFYNTLGDGQIVHYSHGFGQYIRCRIVSKNNKKSLLPFALVGEWRSLDLPRRMDNGDIQPGYYAEKVQNGELFEARAANIWEYDRKGDDPSDLEPIDLSIPEMTPEEVVVANKWRKIDLIRNIVSNYEESNPETILNSVRAIFDTN
jgi:hypothetical protein